MSIILLGLTIPLPAFAQNGFLGVMGGRVFAPLPDDQTFSGHTALAFLQADMSSHVAIRSEAGWLRTGMDQELQTFAGPYQGATSFEFLTLNLQGRLYWETPNLPGADFGLRFFALGGGWLGYRWKGTVLREDPRRADFGHLLGVGSEIRTGRFMAQMDARWYHGEVALWKGGSHQSGSQLTFGVGYRIH